MGSKSKKAPKNAYGFFIGDYIEDQKKLGRNVSLKIAAEECGPLWSKLDEKEKTKYVQLAALHKEYSKQDKTKKFTSTGISYAELEQQQLEQKLKTEKADGEIRNTISSLDFESLKRHLFYIIHCNYYCKTDAGNYVPGELAIAEFNLQSGIRRTFHTLINPGEIPIGLAYEAKKTIEEIHGLPHPPYEEGDSDYLGILNKILRFIEPGKLPDGRYPPLYCIENNIKASENILQFLSYNKSEQSFYRVFLLHKMFFWLKNKCVEFVEGEQVGFPVMSSAENEITRDVFCYAPGISCSFHVSVEEKYQNCSLSVVQRYVFVVCDHCCQYLNIQLVPGKHCRLKCEMKKKVRREPLPQSSTSRMSPPPSEVDYDGRSSYADDFSCLDWKKDPGSAAVDESEMGAAALTKREKETAEDEDFDDEDGDKPGKFRPFGRGAFRH